MEVCIPDMKIMWWPPGGAALAARPVAVRPLSARRPPPTLLCYTSLGSPMDWEGLIGNGPEGRQTDPQR